MAALGLREVAARRRRHRAAAGWCCADADEEELLRFASPRGAGIVVTPVGGQGFLLGRGNQQLSPRVIRAVGRRPARGRRDGREAGGVSAAARCWSTRAMPPSTRSWPASAGSSRPTAARWSTGSGRSPARTARDACARTAQRDDPAAIRRSPIAATVVRWDRDQERSRSRRGARDTARRGAGRVRPRHPPAGRAGHRRRHADRARRAAAAVHGAGRAEVLADRGHRRRARVRHPRPGHDRRRRRLARDRAAAVAGRRLVPGRVARAVGRRAPHPGRLPVRRRRRRAAARDRRAGRRRCRDSARSCSAG